MLFYREMSIVEITMKSNHRKIIWYWCLRAGLWVQTFPLRWSSKRQAGKFAYEAIVQKCKRRGNLFARDQLVHKVREDELWYTSQILLVFIECNSELFTSDEGFVCNHEPIFHTKSSLSHYFINSFLTDMWYNI